jgi:gamma-glutamyltranspeptidase/glutathione hydrolase
MSSSHPSHHPSFRGRASLAAAGALLAVSLAVSVPALSAAEPSGSFAVATESPAATKQASRLLEAGGNAIDAAVLAALVSGFTNPSASGIGGGGFALVWSARDKRVFVLDFREVAPAAIDARLLDKRPVADEQRGQLVGVPGEVAGLFELHQRFGKTKWQALVARAARLAEQGFVTEPHTAGQVDEQKASLLSRSPAFRGVYLPAGTPPKLGQTLRSPKLAKTLRRIAAEGRRGFYEGPVASDIVSAVKSVGGGLQLSDLAAYQPVSREPLRVSWDGKEVLTMPPPSAGGLLVAQTLALFSRAELVAMNDAPAKRIHLLAEAMRGAFADRARYVGDPAFSQVDIAKLLSPTRLARRKQRIAEDRTHTQPRFGLEEAGTHHLVSADGDGNWISLATTINDAFGAKLVAEQSGIILNNELADFSTAESVAIFGMTESPNRPRPGARPVSSMSPTLVLEQGEPVLALGGSGALTIAPNVTQVLLNLLAFELEPAQALSAPRFTVPSPRTGQTLWLEAALAKPYVRDLAARGELLLTKDSKNAVQLVMRAAGKLQAAADPRKGGAAEVRNPAQ